MRTTVIYHRADFDGVFCYQIAKKFLGETSDIEYIGWDYGDPVPEVPEDATLYIMDLSIDELMGHPNLIWIDHHKSAIDKWEGPDDPEVNMKISPRIPGYRIDGVAACRLAWQWFNLNAGSSVLPDSFLPQKYDFVARNVTEPLAVQLAGEYDIWDKRNPDAELFQEGLRSQDLSPDDWSALFEWPEEHSGKLVVRLLNQGRGIQFYRRAQDAEAIKRCGYEVNWEGLNFLACNWGAGRFNSLSFTAGIKPEHDALLGYRFDGQKYSVSLYQAPGKEHHDLSMIAKKYGGGGHKGACGFTSSFRIWEE